MHRLGPQPSLAGRRLRGLNQECSTSRRLVGLPRQASVSLLPGGWGARPETRARHPPAPGASGAAAGSSQTPPDQPAGSQPQPQPSTSGRDDSISTNSFQLKPIHVVLWTIIFAGGALFATLTLQFTADVEFAVAVNTVLRRVAKSVAFRQLVVITVAIGIVRFGLPAVLKAMAKFSSTSVQWDKTTLYYILREVYQPLELLLFVAAICTIADSFVPSLVAIPKSVVSHVVRSIISMSFILGFATVVFNLKSRFCKENAWQAEMKGDVTTQRRWEAYDKLGTFVIYVMSFVLGVQAIGLEITSVLAIGGIGGLAIGLAGREICENLLNGFLIMSTNPFEVGDEVHFFHTSKQVEGLVIDIGWYRTLIRSFEREVFVIPNAVFSKNIVLNITRKNREWRFYEFLALRVQDVQKCAQIVRDIRAIIRNDTRVINKLHRRVFLDKVTHDDCKIYISFYLEANNRDSFMAIKQDLLLSFIDVVERNGAKLATPRTLLEVEPEVTNTMAAMHIGMHAGAAAQQAVKRAMPVLPEGKVMDVQIQDTAGPSGGGGGSGSNGGLPSSSGSGTAVVVGVGAPGVSSSSGSGGGSKSKSGSSGGSSSSGSKAGSSGGGVAVAAATVSSSASSQPSSSPSKAVVVASAASTAASSSPTKASAVAVLEPVQPVLAVAAAGAVTGNNVVTSGVAAVPVGSPMPSSLQPSATSTGNNGGGATSGTAAVQAPPPSAVAPPPAGEECPPAMASVDVLPPARGQPPQQQSVAASSQRWSGATASGSGSDSDDGRAGRHGPHVVLASFDDLRPDITASQIIQGADVHKH